jgi:hypothetical protein
VASALGPTVLAAVLAVGLAAPAFAAHQRPTTDERTPTRRDSASTFPDELARFFPRDTSLYAELRPLDTKADRQRAAGLLERLLDGGLPGEITRGAKPLLPSKGAELAVLAATRVAFGLVSALPPPTVGARESSPRAPSEPVSAPPARRFLGVARFAQTSDLDRKRGVFLASVAPGTAAARRIRSTAPFGRDVEVFALDDKAASPSYAFAETHLLWGELEAVEAALATVALPESQTLARRGAVAVASAQFGGAPHVLLSANLAPLVAEARSALGRPANQPLPVDPRSDAEWSFLGLEALSAFAAAVRFDTGTIRTRLVLDLDRSRTGFVSTLLAPPSIAGRAADLMPADADVVVSAGLDLPTLYDLARKEPLGFVGWMLGVSQDELAEIDGAFTAQYDQSFRDDILAAFGSEVAFGVGNPAPKLGAASSIRLYGAVEVRRPEVVATLMTRLQASLSPPLARKIGPEDRDGVRVWTLGNRAMALVDGFLVGGSTGSVEALLEARRTGATLGARPAVAAETRYAARGLGLLLFLSPRAVTAVLDDVFPAARATDLGALLGRGQGIVAMVTTEEPGLVADLSTVPIERSPAPPQPKAGEEPPVETFGLLSGNTLIPESQLGSVIPILDVVRYLGSQTSREGPILAHLEMFAAAEERFRELNSRFGTLRELVEAGIVEAYWADNAEKLGYRFSIELTAGDGSSSADSFGIVAVPIEYARGTTRSYYLGNDWVVRSADKGGGPATRDDEPAVRR